MTTAGLNSFQIAIANLFFSLPESQGFLLAGGGALIAQGIVPRVTEDLDLFTSRGRTRRFYLDARLARKGQTNWERISTLRNHGTRCGDC